MKKARVSLMALALAIGVAGALTTKAHSSKIENNKKLIVYNWVPVDANGHPTGGAEYFGNSGGAEAFFGCSGSVGYCAQAYDGAGNPEDIYIYHN